MSRKPPHLALPFETEVLGIPVTVEGINISAPQEIVAICRRGTKRQKIGILHLPLPKNVYTARTRTCPRKRRFYVTDNKYWPVDQWWG
jgi:hypothetical protein